MIMLSFMFYICASSPSGALLGACTRLCESEQSAYDFAWDFAQRVYSRDGDCKVKVYSCRAPYHGPRVIYYPPF